MQLYSAYLIYSFNIKLTATLFNNIPKKIDSVGWVHASHQPTHNTFTLLERGNTMLGVYLLRVINTLGYELKTGRSLYL